MPYASGQTLGPWSLAKRLGRGGNGEVWLATNASSDQVALKILSKTSDTAYLRFKSEIEAMQFAVNIPGVLPVLASHLPTDLKSGDAAWFTMPVAVPFSQIADNKTPLFIGSHILSIAETLVDLHAKRITHRDIKPANLLWWQSRATLGDFGLAKYPKRVPITLEQQSVGARDTIAPEMRRSSTTANGAAADVYSLSKTLWMLLTNEKLGFEGQYSSESSVGIRAMNKTLHSGALDKLLTAATENAPTARPTMREFAELLRKWISELSNFGSGTTAKWRDVRERLFPHGIPSRTEWTSLPHIVAVLSEVSESGNYNHLFFPTGGGLDLLGAKVGRITSTIELQFGTSAIHVAKPARLLFEGIGHVDWDYFRLELEYLSPSGVYAKTWGSEHDMEEVVELPNGNFVPRSCWDEDRWKGRPLPKKSRLLARFSEGSMVIFHKGSPYNKAGSTYDGRHSRMNADTFRKYIAQNYNSV